MSEIVGACLSQFHDDPNSFELLLAYSDGREIGHTVSRTAAQRIAATFTVEFVVNDPATRPVIDVIDPRTGRPLGDHGTAIQAIEYALDRAGPEADTFLKSWREGSLDEWPEFYAWLISEESSPE